MDQRAEAGLRTVMAHSREEKMERRRRYDRGRGREAALEAVDGGEEDATADKVATAEWIEAGRRLLGVVVDGALGGGVASGDRLAADG